MTRWKYTLNSGSALREAIDNDDMEQVVKCLLFCYKELQSKLDDEDKEYYKYDIEDTIEVLTLYELNPDDEDNVNYYLEEFYDLCDELRAWVEV